MATKIAVIGSGEMGHGIAELAALRGFQVGMQDVEPEYVQRGMERIRWSLAKLVERKEVSEEQANAAIARITTTTHLAEAVRDADVVIEAVFEDLELKKRVFIELDAHAPSRSILASNTSGLRITEMAHVTRRPDKVVGMHFFNPVVMMPLIEIVRGEDTSDETVGAMVDLSRTLQKTPIVCRKDVPGFITTRTIANYMYEAAWIHDEEGVSTEIIDSAMRFKVGFPMGPFELADRVGVDLLKRISNAQGLAVPPSVARLTEAGKHGQKTGQGFYDYRQGGKPTIAVESGRNFDPWRILAPVVNEAARLVEWEVATPEEIDLAMRLGTAFPKGPLRLADEHGLDAVLATLANSTRHRAVKLLEDKVSRGELGSKSGRGFYEHAQEGSAMTYETILVTKEFETNVATITLNRPDRLNTITPDMVEELDRALGELERAEDVRCLVITGAGDRSFSAGADVTSFGGADRSYKSWSYSHRTQQVLKRLGDFPKPTVAAINGYCFGGGLEIALACDFRVAARRAKIGQTELSLGLLTGAGGIPRLVRLLGLAKAKELVLLAHRLSADEAHDLGLVTRAFDNEEFAAKVRDFAGKLARSAPIAYRLAKGILNRAPDMSLEAALAAESLAFGHVTSTEDVFEGIQAMMEKREPKFKGQ